MLDALFKLVAEPNLCNPKDLVCGEEVKRLAPGVEDAVRYRKR